MYTTINVSKAENPRTKRINDIRDLQEGEVVVVGLIICNAVWTFTLMPTFRRKILHPSSGLKRVCLSTTLHGVTNLEPKNERPTGGVM
jgi:hypothetical protein